MIIFTDKKLLRIGNNIFLFFIVFVFEKAKDDSRSLKKLKSQDNFNVTKKKIDYYSRLRIFMSLSDIFCGFHQLWKLIGKKKLRARSLVSFNHISHSVIS